MLDIGKLARPYAEAAFDFAREKNQVPQWSSMLEKLSQIVKQPLVNKVLRSPKPTSRQLVEVFIDISDSELDVAGKNFIKTLAHNRRLLLLPEISRTYETLRAISERVLHVKVTSAIALEKTYQEKLKKALGKKLQHEITLECQIDENLMGGLVIKAGDTVIDNSIIGQLARLKTNLVR